MRRLTELDLEALPAAGAVARRAGGDRASRREPSAFVPRELGHYVAEVVIDLAEGLGGE